MSRAIAILGFPGFQMLDVAGPFQMFSGANDELGFAAYALSLVGPTAGPLRTSSGLEMLASVAYADLCDDRATPLDTLITVGGAGLLDALQSGEIVGIVAGAPDKVRRIASVCTGAFFLAAAGLLDGRRATTHWRAVDRLRQFRPQVTVDPDAIHVRDDPYWTSAGVTAGIDLALAMIESDHGRDLALKIARRHLVFRIRPGGQSQFSSDLMSEAAQDERIARLTRLIAAHPDRDWRLEALADAANLSVRSLTRAFRRELDLSPAEYVERVRVDAARRALLDSRGPVEAIAHRCGFGSLRRMDRAFARAVSISPSQFRERFNSNATP
jgi:transcriptional regulator GlxA family with amidase domain